MVEFRKVFEVAETADTEVIVVSEYLAGLADLPFAVVALYFVGGVEDILDG